MMKSSNVEAAVFEKENSSFSCIVVCGRAASCQFSVLKPEIFFQNFQKIRHQR